MAGKNRGAGKGKVEKGDDGSRLVGRNRRAFYDYEVLEQIEAGVALQGTEVKSLRDGHLTLGDGYVKPSRDELYLYNVNIPEYKQGGVFNHDPMRPRKLLLHRREIDKIGRRIAEKGLTVVPLSVYFNRRGLCKVKLGICRGKRQYDKRRAIADRDVKRQLAAARKHGEL